MTAPLPPGLDPTDEIEIEWDRGPKKTKVTASLGKAKIKITTDDESASLVPWLVASLPQILEAAWTAIEEDEAQEAK